VQLLGPYNSKLQAFFYEELLNLYKASIDAGAFAGNTTFNVAAIQNLISKSQSFASTLPLPAAGQRVTDDSLNNPLQLLQAMYNALIAEANDFGTKSAALISVLEKDTLLLDQLLAAANLQVWQGKQPKLHDPQVFAQDFGVGFGPTTLAITQEDPQNGVIYTNECQVNTYLDVIDGVVDTGLAAPASIISVPAKQMSWTWPKMTPGEQAQDLYGDGWAELILLEDRPIINFAPQPSTQVILPTGGTINGIFSVHGSVLGGSLPIYVRTLFTPRRDSVVMTPQNAISDGGFEAGGVGWESASLWTIETGAAAHTGSKYVQTIGNGDLISSSFPVNPYDNIYLDAFVEGINGANGSIQVVLSLRDQSDNELGERALGALTVADTWQQTFGVVQAISNQSVVAGRLIIRVVGNTTGNWLIDDVRVHIPQTLSQYQVGLDNVNVFTTNADGTPLHAYFQNEDYVVDDASHITFEGLSDTTPYVVRFTEYFPAYQCSVNQSNWSPLIMLDSSRPYPDNITHFFPISIRVDSHGNRTLFPITDELGVPTGLTLQVLSRVLYEYTFVVTTPADPHYGATAILEIDLSYPSYMNGLRLSPYAEFPIKLLKVEIESFTSDTRQTAGAPNILLDRPTVLTFPTSLVRKIYLTVYQENYTYEEYVVQAPDQLRIDTLASVQSVLPFNIRQPQRTPPTYHNGAQYEFGLENVAGIAASPALPGVFVSGPYHFIGIPEVSRFDAQTEDSPNVESYLCFRAYSASGAEVDVQLQGIRIYPGTCEVFPFANTLDRTTVATVDVYIKTVLRTADAVMDRFQLQITSA